MCSNPNPNGPKAAICKVLSTPFAVAREKSGLSDRLILGRVAWQNDVPCANCLVFGWTKEGNGHGICKDHSQSPSTETMAAYLDYYKEKTE